MTFYIIKIKEMKMLKKNHAGCTMKRMNILNICNESHPYLKMHVLSSNIEQNLSLVTRNLKQTLMNLFKKKTIVHYNNLVDVFSFPEIKLKPSPGLASSFTP